MSKSVLHRAIGLVSIRLSLPLASTLAAPLLVLPTIAQVPTIRAVVTGPPVVVYDYTAQVCPNDPWTIPDASTVAWRTADGNVHILLSMGGDGCGLCTGVLCGLGSDCGLGANHQMSGPDFDHLQLSCAPVMLSSKDPSYCSYNSREWIGAVWTPDGVNVYALIHNEYHYACNFSGCDPGEFCDTRALTFAQSTDGGATFVSPAVPQHLVASDPYPYRPGEDNHIGMEGVTGILQHPTDGYFYAMFDYGSVGAPVFGLGNASLMRTNNLAAPSSWRGWGGAASIGGSGAFDVVFADPCAGSIANPPAHLPWPWTIRNYANPTPVAGMREGRITFNTYLDCFVWVGWGVPVGFSQVVLCYGISADLLDWSLPRAFDTTSALGLPYIVTPGEYAYPGMIDHDSPSLSFDVSGEHAFIYLVRVNSTEAFPCLDRDLVRIPITFIKT